MPLLFVLSGYFARPALARPWRQVRRTRIFRFYYLYLVWLAIHALVLALLPANEWSDLWTRLPFLVLVGVTWSWYLWALAVYFVAARLLVRLPWVLGLGSGVIAVVLGTLTLPVDGISLTLMVNFPWFIAGALLPGVVDWTRDHATLPTALGALAAYLAAFKVAGLLGIRFTLGVFPALVALGVLTGIALAVVGSRVGWLRTAGSWIGGRTLPIYVLHVPVLIGLHTALRAVDFRPTVFYPVWVALVVVAVSLALYAGLARVAPWLFELPGRRVIPASQGPAPIMDSSAPAEADTARS